MRFVKSLILISNINKILSKSLNKSGLRNDRERKTFKVIKYMSKKRATNNAHFRHNNGTWLILRYIGTSDIMVGVVYREERTGRRDRRSAC